MYISEAVKGGLRPYAGQAVQIDAQDVVQKMNPGDGLISRFEYLGPAEVGRRTWVSLEGIRLTSSVRIQPDGKLVATLSIENTNPAPVKLFSQELALTVLAKRVGERNLLTVSDGPSFALITRQSFEIGSSEPRLSGRGIHAGKSFAWSLGEKSALPHEFALGPKEKKNLDVELELPDGQYEFLCGYGGGVHEGKCVASNLSAFDVEKGKARVVDVKTR